MNKIERAEKFSDLFHGITIHLNTKKKIAEGYDKIYENTKITNWKDEYKVIKKITGYECKKPWSEELTYLRAGRRKPHCYFMLLHWIGYLQNHIVYGEVSRCVFKKLLDEILSKQSSEIRSRIEDNVRLFLEERLSTEKLSSEDDNNELTYQNPEGETSFSTTTTWGFKQDSYDTVSENCFLVGLYLGMQWPTIGNKIPGIIEVLIEKITDISGYSYGFSEARIRIQTGDHHRISFSFNPYYENNKHKNEVIIISKGPTSGKFLEIKSPNSYINEDMHLEEFFFMAQPVELYPDIPEKLSVELSVKLDTKHIVGVEGKKLPSKTKQSIISSLIDNRISKEVSFDSWMIVAKQTVKINRFHDCR